MDTKMKLKLLDKEIGEFVRSKKHVSNKKRDLDIGFVAELNMYKRKREKLFHEWLLKEAWL